MRTTIDIVTALATGLLVGCSADDETQLGTTIAAYSIGTQLITPDDSRSYVAFADDVDRQETLTLDSAIEAGAAGGVFASAELAGAFFTAEEGGVLQRWRVANDPANATATRDGTISFAGEGLTSFFPTATHIQFLAPTKAYLLSSAFAEVIVWDPLNLEIRGVIEIPDLPTEVDGAAGAFSLSAVRIGDRLMYTYNYFGDPASFVRQSYLVVLDTTTDAVEVDHTSDCGDLTYGVASDNGDAYWASSFFNAALNRVDPDAAPAPCLLVVPNGTAQFAATPVSLTELAQGRPAGNLVPAGGDKALFRVYHEEAVAIAPDADAVRVVAAPAWRWWQVDLRELSARELEGSSFGTGQTVHYEVDGQSYVVTLSDDYSESTIERVVADSAPVPGLKVTGVARFGLVKYALGAFEP